MVVIVLILLLIALVIGSLYTEMKMNKRISFKEALDLTGLPIVTFTNNDKNFNFLIDSGSTESFIDKNIVSNFEHVKIDNIYNTVITATGNAEAEVINASIKYRDNVYTGNFNCLDLSGPFDEIKKKDGVQIHGILGTEFFKKYKYIIDFSDFIFYTK